MDLSSIPQWAVPVEPVSEAQIVKTYTADVVILGAGYSGTAAARAAAEAGAKVLVMEQQQEKSFQCFGAQYGSVNSEFMKKRGAPEVDPVDIIADWQRRSLNRANPALVRQFAYNSGSTFDWYIDPLPEEMKDVMTFMNPWPKHFEGELNGFRNYVGTAIFKNSKFDRSMMGPPPGMDEQDGPGGPPPQAEKKDREPPKMPGAPLSMTESIVYTHGMIQDMGGEFVFGITGEYLEKDETGRVVALIGRNYKKEYFRFQANNGVILAAGDFSGNKQMVMDLLGEYAALTENGEKYPYSPAGRKGKGIQMGLWAGGKMEPGPRGGMWCCVGGNGGPMDGAAFLRLNKHGKRFTNEGIMGYWGAGLQGARQPKGAIYTIWDSNWREELEYQTLDHTAVEPSGADMIAHQLRRAEKNGLEEMRPVGPPGAKKGASNYLACADTIETLADRLGVTGSDRENFIASVARYNELAHKGKDEDFAKDPRQLHPIEKPPFYAFCENERKVGFLMVTVAGLVVDEHQQVVSRTDDEPIPGLFATGNCSGERFPIMYTTPVAGVSIGIAITLGRIVGDYVARNP